MPPQANANPPRTSKLLSCAKKVQMPMSSATAVSWCMVVHRATSLRAATNQYWNRVSMVATLLYKLVQASGTELPVCYLGSLYALEPCQLAAREACSPTNTEPLLTRFLFFLPRLVCNFLSFLPSLFVLVPRQPLDLKDGSSRMLTLGQ